MGLFGMSSLYLMYRAGGGNRTKTYEQILLRWPLAQSSRYLMHTTLEPVSGHLIC